MKKVTKKLLAVTLIAGASMTSFTGCAFVKPYNTPEFVTIQANQTAFLIPLVGDTSNQGVFESEALLAETKVATKEVQIPKRWIQTGRRSWKGEYRPTARLITVERSPITREWTSDVSSGTDKVNQGVTAKTKDGIKITLNVNATAQIDEAMATKYLYFYNTNGLSNVMDTEIKTMAHSRLIEEVAKYNLKDLDIETIVKTVREEVQSYFLNRGITITALGLSSDPIYPDDIQKAMNEKVKAQQSQEAQGIKNQTAEDEAKSEAEQMRLRQETFQKQLEMKQLEVQEKLIEAWKSGGAQVPQIVGADGLNVLTGTLAADKK